MTDPNYVRRTYTARYTNDRFGGGGMHGKIEIKAIGHEEFITLTVRLRSADLGQHLPCTKTLEVEAIEHNFPFERERIFDAMLYAVPHMFIANDESPLRIRSMLPTVTLAEAVLKTLSEKIRTSIPIADGGVGIITKGMGDTMKDYLAQSLVTIKVL